MATMKKVKRSWLRYIVLLTGPVLFLQPGSAIQITGCMAIAYLFLVVHMKVRPFRDKCVHRVYTQSSLALVFTLISAIMLKAYGCIGDVTSAGDVDQSWAQWLFFVALSGSNAYAGLIFLCSIFYSCSKMRRENIALQDPCRVDKEENAFYESTLF